MSTEEDYLKECARRYGAELRFAVSPDPAAAIRTELEREPRAIAALTTHGRTAWTEAIIGSVAFQVLREAMRPVLLFRAHQKDCEAPNKITNVTAAGDGSVPFPRRSCPTPSEPLGHCQRACLWSRRCRCTVPRRCYTSKSRISSNRPTCIDWPPKSKPFIESKRNGKCCMENRAMHSVST
jgi:hypothetical protein